MYMKQVFFKLFVCTYSACFLISKCITCKGIFPTKMMKVTRKKKNHLLFYRSLELSKPTAGFIGVTMFLEGAAYKITWIYEPCTIYAFWKFHSGDVKLYSVPSILISTRKHFKALGFKIMFLGNSVDVSFWNTSWTYFPLSRKLFSRKKIAFVCRTRTFLLQWCSR